IFSYFPFHTKSLSLKGFNHIFVYQSINPLFHYFQIYGDSSVTRSLWPDGTMAKLTKRIVDAASPREAAYFLWCSELSGFGCRVHPTGKRVYMPVTGISKAYGNALPSGRLG